MPRSQSKCVTHRAWNADLRTLPPKPVVSAGSESRRTAGSGSANLSPPPPAPSVLTGVWDLGTVERLLESVGLKRVRAGKTFHHCQPMGVHAANRKQAWGLESKTAVS